MDGGLVCPECASRLRAQAVGAKRGWSCAVCSGVLLNLGVVRTQISEQVARDFWSLARSAPASKRSCPSCRRALCQIEHALAAASVELELCTACQLIWFDQGELEQLGPIRASEPPKPKLRPSFTGVHDFEVTPRTLIADAVPELIGGAIEIALEILFSGG